MALTTEKIPTFIEGFDDLLGGGIPQNHVVLITGLPGTMKSSLCYAILLENVRRGGRKAAYVSFEQTHWSLESQMAGMGFDLEAARGQLRVLDVALIQKKVNGSSSRSWLAYVKRVLETYRTTGGVDLLVVDSLEALEVLAKFEDRRKELFRLFEWLRDFRITTFVVTEAPPDGILAGLAFPPTQRDEMYLADGVIELKMHFTSEVDLQRRIRVVKMRESNHKTGFQALVFEGGRFQVTPVIST